MEFAELLCIDDFKSKVPSIFVLNDTSKTQYLDNTICTILELGEKEATLQMPEKSCAPGHSLVVYFFLDNKFRKLDRVPSDGEIEGAVRVRSKIKGITIEGKETFVNIEFTQYSKPQWLGYLEELIRLPAKNYETVKKMRQME